MRGSIAFVCLLLVVFGTALVCPANETGPAVAIWHFDEGSGSVAYDSSDNGNDGTLQGDPQWTTDTASGTGYALDFDGVGDYVEVPDDASQYGMTQLTLDVWICPRSYPEHPWRIGIVSKWGPGGVEDDSYELRMEPEGTITFMMGRDSSTGNDIWVRTSDAVPLNRWTRITATYDGNRVRIYVNGEFDNSNEFHRDSIADSGMPIWIAKANNSYGETSYFDGMIDEVKIFPLALAPSQGCLRIASPPDFYYNTILLSWTPIDEANRYLFEYQIGGNTSSIELHDNWLRLTSGDHSSWAFFAGLGTMRYRVSALDASGGVLEGPTDWANCTCY